MPLSRIGIAIIPGSGSFDFSNVLSGQRTGPQEVFTAKAHPHGLTNPDESRLLGVAETPGSTMAKRKTPLRRKGR